MKKANSILVIILLLMAGCGSKQSTDDLIIVDVTKSYPEKELILQDFMDVEYIVLETTDEFLTHGLVLSIGRDIILVRNRVRDGNIFIYDKDGKGLRKINRMGQGGEEYIDISGIVLDEDTGEMFVNDVFTKKIFVYDLYGKFKRSFRHKEDAMYNSIYNFNRENLICYDGSSSNEGQSFAVISKQDGSITKEIQIPFKEKKTVRLRVRDEVNNTTFSVGPTTIYPIIPYYDNWILTEYSSDTVFRYLPDHNMTPFIIRTPSIQSMDPEVFLFSGIITDHYYFMETVKKVYDFATQDGFPSTDLVYDKQENAIFQYAVYNDDYSNKKQVYMMSRPVNDKIASWQPLEAYQLVEAYEKGELKYGKLKEIASKLDAEDNPVIMLVKHKK